MKAIEIFVAHFSGNQSEAARALGKKPGHVWHWINKGKDMPVELVPEAARIIGKNPCELRPDIFPDSGSDNNVA